MHEALRHHTLLQLKAGGTPPTPGLVMGNSPCRDANTKFRGDGGGGSVTLRNLLVGTRGAARESRRLPSDNDDAQACAVSSPVDHPALSVAKGPPANSSPMSTVHRLMTELLGVATEFKRLHNYSEDGTEVDADKDDEAVSLVASAVSFQSGILYVLGCCTEFAVPLWSVTDLSSCKRCTTSEPQHF